MARNSLGDKQRSTVTPPRHDLPRMLDEILAQLRADPARTDEGEPLWSEDELQAMRLEEWNGNVFAIDGREIGEMCRISFDPKRGFWFEEIGKVNDATGLDAYRLAPPAVSAADLEQQADAALAVVKAAPPAVFCTDIQRRARYSAGLALIAQAIVVFDEVRASGDVDTLEAAGFLGDAQLIRDAWDLAEGFRQDMPRWSAAPEKDWVLTRCKDLADGSADDEDGQRRMVAIAEAIEERFPPAKVKP